MTHNKILTPYRQRIDALDEQIVALLATRMAIVREVGSVKFKHGIAPILPDRIEEVLSHVASLAEGKRLKPGMIREIYTILIAESCALEEEIARALESGNGHSAKP